MSTPCVDLSRQRLRASYGRKMAEQAGVKLVPIQQNTWQKIQSVTKTVFGRQEYIPTEIKFTKPSLVVGSDPPPGTVVDVCITAGGNISAAHSQFDVDGDYVTVCDMGSAAGTFLDDVKLGDDECAVLEPGMRVILGEVRAIRVRGGEAVRRGEGGGCASIDGSSSEASLEDRLADRKAWISPTTTPETSERHSTSRRRPEKGHSRAARRGDAKEAHITRLHEMLSKSNTKKDDTTTAVSR